MAKRAKSLASSLASARTKPTMPKPKTNPRVQRANATPKPQTAAQLRADVERLSAENNRRAAGDRAVARVGSGLSKGKPKASTLPRSPSAKPKAPSAQPQRGGGKGVVSKVRVLKGRTERALKDAGR